MTPTIVQQSRCSQNGNTLIIEASTLELPPGEFPQFVGIETPTKEVILFGPRRTVETSNDEVTGVRYFSRNTPTTLLIIND